MKDVSYTLAFFAGVLSFLSPCVLPLLPSYVSFITGLSFKDLTVRVDRKAVRYLTLTNSLAFIGGFSFVFIALGISSSAVGGLLFQYIDYIRIIGGILVIIFGLFISDILSLDFFMKDKRIHLTGKPAGYFGTFLVGMTFAAGWSPCVGPYLGTILLYAGSKGSMIYGLKLLTVYSLGLGIPFLLSALAINTFLSYSPKIVKYMRAIKIVSGVILIIFGVMLLTDRLRVLSNMLPDFGIKF
ncbi:MAG: cytochrome c biogenesis protein CcdA [Thermodesulfovibrionales bacterium]|jgi:cytochrome c-type biogenesis protein